MRIFLVVLIMLTSVNAHAGNTTIVDGLNGLSTDFALSHVGTGGYPVTVDQLIGPRFTLSEPTSITEIGGFVDVAGKDSPLVVQIRPQINGLPASSGFLANLVVSNDNLPGVFRYESVRPNLSLGAGTYYALFVPQSFQGGILSTIGTTYVAGSMPVGIVRPFTGDQLNDELHMAVRITGTVPEPDTMILFAIGLIPAMYAISTRKRSWPA
jgi:hypothetical protein